MPSGAKLDGCLVAACNLERATDDASSSWARSGRELIGRDGHRPRPRSNRISPAPRSDQPLSHRQFKTKHVNRESMAYSIHDQTRF